MHAADQNCPHQGAESDVFREFNKHLSASYIEDGNQKITEGTYGKSITDACLGWEKTERLILELAELL